MVEGESLPDIEMRVGIHVSLALVLTNLSSQILLDGAWFVIRVTFTISLNSHSSRCSLGKGGLTRITILKFSFYEEEDELWSMNCCCYCWRGAGM